MGTCGNGKRIYNSRTNYKCNDDNSDNRDHDNHINENRRQNNYIYKNHNMENRRTSAAVERISFI